MILVYIGGACGDVARYSSTVAMEFLDHFCLMNTGSLITNNKIGCSNGDKYYVSEKQASRNFGAPEDRATRGFNG